MNLFAKIEDLDVTVRVKTVCRHIKVDTVYDLMTVKLPEVGESVYCQPLARVNVIYSERVDMEIRAILNGVI